MNWKETNKYLGTLKENSKITFEYESTIPLNIYKISPGCSSCTTVGKYENNKFSATFKSGKIPKHLASNQGHQDLRNIIVVTYSDGSKEILSFTARVVNDKR